MLYKLFEIKPDSRPIMPDHLLPENFNRKEIFSDIDKEISYKNKRDKNRKKNRQAKKQRRKNR